MLSPRLPMPEARPMKKWTPILLAVLLSGLSPLPAAAAQTPEPLPKSKWVPGAALDLREEDWDTEVLQAPVPVLVDFWAEWCGPCRIQGPIVEMLAKRMGRAAVVAKLDVDRNRDLSQRYGVRAIPTLAVFKDGKLVKRFVGVTKLETLERALRDAAKSKRGTPPEP